MKRLTISLCCFAVAGYASAVTWNLADDFSIANNPNGPWAYGKMDAGAFVPATAAESGGVDWWKVGSTVCVGKFHFDGYGIDAEQVSMECDYLVPAVRFTAPFTGVYGLNLAIGGRTDNYGGGHGNNNPAGAHLLVQGVEKDAVSFVGNVRAWQLSGLSMAQGDHVLVYIDQRYIGGNNMAKLTVEAVPEPATLAVLGLGLAALARRRKA